MHARKERKDGEPNRKLLLWAAVIGLVCGLINLGYPLENLLRASRNSLHWHKASGDIVLVKIDDRSLREVGRWPWRRSRHAELTDALTRAGPNRIFYDVIFSGPTDSTEDRAFAEALQRSGRVFLAAKAMFGPITGAQQQDELPDPAFAKQAEIGSISVTYNYQNAVWRIPYSSRIEGKPVASFSAKLAGRQPKDGFFIPDYSVDPTTVPAVSAVDVIRGRVSHSTFTGKDVIIGTTSDQGSDKFFLPGTGKMGGVYVHIIGAETLKSGTPAYLGWVPLFLLALVGSALALFRRGPLQQGAILGGTFAALALGPVPLETSLIYVDVMPGLFAIAWVGAGLAWQRFRQRGFVDAASGLPNLNALRANRAGRDQALIVARVLNYAEVVATLPADRERQLIEQIVSRLSVGSPDRTLYQGDDGIFAWFEESRKPFGHHIDALYALFRNPVRVGGLSLDLSVSFGVEIGSGRSLSNRLGSALVAADEAAHDGLKWKYHDPETLEDASWKLSILSQLDSAIDKGEVWIAFQPQLDLKTRRIVGAEALARWTHPEKGPIAASEFIAAAEQHDRIGKLTDFILEKAIAASAAINRRGQAFDVAVNLSARLLTDRQFSIRVAAMLARHNLEPRHLTLELTETAELADRGESLEMLTSLRDLDIKISIDDYGTGLSTLEYLKKIPASEIKIDQSFVKGLCDNRSDRLMVQSTIGLAHSLDRRVVAEGVEQRDILDALIEMGCDVAQGFIIGRPMSLESLTKRLAGERRRSAA